MLKKPFKPPGSKDAAASGGQSPSAIIAKPVAKPIVSSLARPLSMQSLPAKELPEAKSQTTQETNSTSAPPSPISVKPAGPIGLKGTSKQFKPVSIATPAPNASATAAKTADPSKDGGEKAILEEFHKCYWSKDVKKKHKVLDDGIIVFHGNKIQLYNSDGQKIYDSFSSKLYCPNPDNTDQYIVGSFFVEQDASIKKEDFLSGRCFVKAKMTFDKDQLEKKKKLSVPLKLNKTTETQKPSDIQVPAKAFLLTDSTNPEIFPVFIDPYLSENMRIHQKQGVKFMFECISGLRGPDISGCILADSMGLGKTLQSIALIWTLIRRSPFSSTQPMLKKVVVVAPVSLLGTWKKEVKKWLGEERLSPKIAIGSRENVVKACTEFAMGPQKMLLISYEQFRLHVDELANSCDLLIFDEGHRLKNMNIKTFRSFNSIKCHKRIILTGTPLQNSLDEFYSCVKFVNPNVFENEKQFKFVFSDPILAALKSDATPQTVEKAAVRSKELTHIISKFVLRRKADILEKLLPPRSEYFIFLKLTDLQEFVYKKMILARTLKSEFESDTGAFSLLTVMRKLLNHPQLIYTDENNQASQEFKQHFPQDFALADWDKSYKFKFVSDILNSMKAIEQSTSSIERVIIVSYWTQTLDVLEMMIKEKNLKFVRLDGSVNAQKRQDLIDRFQDPQTQLRVFLLCGKAGGTGLNLSSANRMILMEPDWNPSNDLQVMGRIWRDGQTKPVHIYRLISCGTMEEKVLQRQFLKEDLSQNVVDDKMIVKAHNNELMKQLFQYKGDHKCLTFKEDENDLSKLKIHSPDYVEGMESYIDFVKRTIKGEKGKENEAEKVESQPTNEFDEGNIFLKPEAPPEEDEPDANSEGEEAEEKMLHQLEDEDKGDKPLEKKQVQEFKEDQILETIKEQDEQTEIEADNTGKEQDSKPIENEVVENLPEKNTKKGRKRGGAVNENPSLQILKKLKK